MYLGRGGKADDLHSSLLFVFSRSLVMALGEYRVQGAGQAGRPLHRGQEKEEEEETVSSRRKERMGLVLVRFFLLVGTRVPLIA